MADIVRKRLERDGVGGWEVSVDGMWCRVHPPGHRERAHGWKLHVAATGSSAAVVLERSLGVLVRHRCAFKCARSAELTLLLNSRYYPRGGAGKFLTAYPDDDEHLRRVAAELDQATAGLPGPAILSDRPYRAGSLVHYRYGGFSGGLVLSNDGMYLPMLQGPDGSLVQDRRDAWFAPPAWAPSLFGEPEVAEDGAGPVLLADRFLVREAIRHANKGGVFRALDTHTGAEVVVKQARPYVEFSEAGQDVCDAMRHEAEMLDVLAPLGVAPRKLALFEQGGQLFLAEELIPGVGLRRWAADHVSSGPGLPWPLVTALTRRLARLLGLVHGAGVAVRDFSPNNLITSGEGEVRLVDLEMAARFGEPGVGRGTPGYAAPEQMAGAAVAAVEADLYSLGAVLFLLATGADPAFGEDLPPVRSTRVRLEGWLAFTAEASEAARRLAPLILGLMETAPERRWDLGLVQTFLATQEQASLAVPAGAAPYANDAPPGGRRLPPGDQQRVITDGVAHLAASMTPQGGWLWPVTCGGASTDPCSVHHGAAGVLAVLTRAHHSRVQGLDEALHTACEWIERRSATEPRLLPGLYFGRSGTAWALYDAARALGDEQLADRALALAKRLPTRWPNPDVTHGAAGVGLLQLHLWQASGDAEFGRRVHRCADGLVAAAEHRPTGVVWPVPASFDSIFAGGTFYGFAHGLAGIAWFLLAAGLATGRDDCLELAREAGETLSAAALREGDRAWWGESPEYQGARMLYWCHGSSGVGTFLIRLWQATGEQRFRELAEQAAVAVYRAKWQCSCAVCHGLAGNGEFLLDMAAALSEDRYREWAEEFAAILFARHAYRHGRIVVPDETGDGFAADYSVGLAGVLAFFLRLRHGGPRMWMAEPVGEGLPLAPVAAGGASR